MIIRKRAYLYMGILIVAIGFLGMHFTANLDYSGCPSAGFATGMFLFLITVGGVCLIVKDWTKDWKTHSLSLKNRNQQK